MRIVSVTLAGDDGRFGWDATGDGWTFAQLVEYLQRLDGDTGDPVTFVSLLLGGDR